ncbi:MAG TPA: glycine cleavage T C-terminal barrel domain-containing protein [Gemmatimonadales bacterium]|jgi:aminomethyltransferase
MTDGYRALTGEAGSFAAEGLGQIEIAGPDAHAFVNRIATADLSLLAPGHFVDALLLRDDASILDRVTIYRFPERVMLLVDAAQRAAVWEHVVSRKRGNIRIRDISDDMSLTAVRGPATFDRLPSLAHVDGGTVYTTQLGGVDVFSARLAMHGADGVDLYCRARDREALHKFLFTSGVLPATTADWTLFRLEWGIATVGVEIDPGDTPMEAALESLVAEGKGAPFPGETALVARRRTGAIKQLVGFHVVGDDAPPAGARVSVAGVMVDRVRSVGRSPRVGIIGMTAVPTTASAMGTELAIVSGNQSWTAHLAPRPFATRVLP